jgi:hypothetical protein
MKKNITLTFVSAEVLSNICTVFNAKVPTVEYQVVLQGPPLIIG